MEIELRSGAVVAGEYRGIDYGAFAVKTQRGLRPAPLEDVREIRAVRGSHAATGLAIGLGADLLAIGVLSRITPN